MKIVKLTLLVSLMGLSLNFMSCDANGDFLLFSINHDIQLGAQMDAQIEASNDFTILSRAAYSDAYAYLDDMVEHILDNGNVTYRDDFEWEVHIIDDAVLNAFVTPGGYIYVYNGLIQYLDTADDLAGVIGHEIAHADQRHGSKAMQREYGIQLLIAIALGEDASQLEQLVAQAAGVLTGLAFSRAAESEADAFSVEYLSQSRYACDGAGTFFQKLTDDGHSEVNLGFLSTHPNPANRVMDISAKAIEVGCSVENFADTATSCSSSSGTEYQCFKEEMLPDL